MSRDLIHSSFDLRLYRLNGFNHDFEIEQDLINGDLLSLKTSDSGRLITNLYKAGVCHSRLKALDLLNQKNKK